jgi:hypothetical protein
MAIATCTAHLRGPCECSEPDTGPVGNGNPTIQSWETALGHGRQAAVHAITNTPTGGCLAGVPCELPRTRALNCRPVSNGRQRQDGRHGSIHPAYNPSFSACFFNQNSIFFSQQISQQCFLVGLSAQPNKPISTS